MAVLRCAWCGELQRHVSLCGVHLETGEEMRPGGLPGRVSDAERSHVAAREKAGLRHRRGGREARPMIASWLRTNMNIQNTAESMKP